MTRRPDKTIALASYARSIGVSACIQLLTLASGVALARVLGPAERGDLAALVLWPTVIALVGSLGVPEAAMYFSSKSNNLARALGEFAFSVVLIAIVQSILYTALTLLVVYPYLLPASTPIPQIAVLFQFYYPLYFVGTYLMCVFNGAGHQRAFQYWRMIMPSVAGAAVLALAITDDLTLSTALLAYLSGQAAAFVAALGLWLRIDVTPEIGFSTIRSLLGWGVKSGLGSAASNLTERAGQVALSVTSSSSQLAYYTVAWSLTTPFNYLASSLSLVALPRIAAADGTATRQAARELLWVTLLLATPAAALLIALAPVLVVEIFGNAFAASASLVRLLAVAGVLLAISRSLGTVLRGLGSPQRAAKGEVLGLAVTVLALAVLVPVADMTGAAVATVIGYLSATAYLIFAIRRAYLPRQPPGERRTFGAW